MLAVRKNLITKSDKKIVLLVADGLGGLPRPSDGRTELEVARTPNLDKLVQEGITGLIEPIEAGIAPGSGPAHLALFGYDPVEYELGRGVLEVLGLGMELKDGDIAIRGNFATMQDGKIVDRRAGRIPTEENRRLVSLFREKIKKIDDVEIIWESGLEHRFALILRGPGLGDEVNDTDPQKEGLPPLPPEGRDEPSKKTAGILKKIIEEASRVLANEEKANFILFRGISRKPDIPTFEERYKMKALGLANYPMYKGLARLVGMDVPELGYDFKALIKYYEEHFDEYDFIFIHYKWTDKAGEDGDFDKKVEYIEELDDYIPRIMAKNPHVFIFTGDHSTPAMWKGHSWHPVPILIVSENAGVDDACRLTEREARKGYLGLRKSKEIMQIALALAGRLKKFGA